jgi:type IV secretory pathway TraG/TraD family ATPase VirD4
MREIYGQNDAQTIVSMCQNTLTLRVPDFQTADYISKNLGSQEIYERDENLSYGSDSSRDGVTITTKRGERELVMASEVQGLPDMTGYLRLAGRNDIMRVKFSYKNYPIIANGLEEKEVIGYALDE